MGKIKRALLSVSDKKGITEFARGLHELGVTLISTGGTAQKLREADLPVVEVSQITDFPEMMDGRVKTLHPAVHGGILAERDNEKHMSEINSQDIDPLDLIVCNLYPFAETVKKKNTGLEQAVENIDIGGPTMIRSAAKNFKNVGVIVDPADYNEILKELRENKCSLNYQKRLELAYKAFKHTANYDNTIQRYFQGLAKNQKDKDELEFPDQLILNYEKINDLRYGENPQQKAAFYRQKNVDNIKGPSITSAQKLHGKDLSFNNINDTNGALELIKEFPEKPAAAVIKHTNPCGAAVASNLLDAYKRAHAGDPLSAYGSIVALNRPVNVEAAQEITTGDKFIEVIIAPSYTDKALEIIKSRWDNIRILKTGKSDNSIKTGIDLKKVTDGLLVQERDVAPLDQDELEIVTEQEPTSREMDDLLFSWKVAKHVKSNAIVMARDEMVVGIGAGQMSRVDAMIIAGRKADGRQKKGVVASDAFFPFPDAIEEAAEKGINAIIQPGGSIRDEEVIQAANEKGIAMVFTGKRHFKH